MKTILPAACIISIACGYIIGKSSSSTPEETKSVSSAQTRYDRSNSRDTRTRGNGENALLDSILGGRSISEIPAADLAALIIKLTKYDPNMDAVNRAKQSYQLELLLAKLSAKDLANIATELNSDPDAENKDKISRVIAALAEKDPKRAMDWISTLEDSSELYPVILSAMAKDDPLTASTLLHSAILDGKIPTQELWSVTYSIGRSTAKLGVDPFLSFMESLPQRQQSNIIYNSITDIPEKERTKLLDQLYQRSQDGRIGGVNMDYVFSSILSKDKASATEWLNTLPENEEKNNYRTKAATSLFENGDKESASEWMRQALTASPGKEKAIIQDVMRRIQYNNPEGIPFFAKLLPEGQSFSAADLETYSHHTIGYGTNGLTDYASAISDPNEKSIFIANSLKMISQTSDSKPIFVNSNDLEILSRKISTIGLTGENATRVNEALEAAKKSISSAKR